MKVIHNGRAPLVSPRKAKCTNCGSVLQYKLNEVQYVDASQSEDVWIDCPVCGEPVDLHLREDEMKYVRDHGGPGVVCSILHALLSLIRAARKDTPRRFRDPKE